MKFIYLAGGWDVERKDTLFDSLVLAIKEMSDHMVGNLDRPEKSESILLTDLIPKKRAAGCGFLRETLLAVFE